jgi:iron complex outermembrane receptor protein
MHRGQGPGEGEFELTWRPLGALSVIGTLGVTDVTLRTFSDPYTAENYAGNRAPAVPAYDGSLRAVLSFKPGFFAEAGVSANGRTYYTEGEDLSLGQRAYTLTAARLGYERAGWRLVFYGSNLGNTRYLSAITPGAGHATPGEPRTLGAEVSRKF